MTRAEADRRVDAAFVRHKQGDLKFAYDCYTMVLGVHPDHAPATHYLGLLAQQSGKSQDAARLLQRAIELDPRDARAHNHLGQVRIALGDREAALACFERAAELDPSHADSLNNLANALRVRDPLRAIELYRQALRIDPRSANAAYNLANALREERGHDEAFELLQLAVQIDPDHFQARQNLGVLLEQRGDFSAAIEQYRAVRRIRPRHVAALANLMSIRSYQPDEQTVRDAEELVEAPATQDEERIKLHNGLGKHRDRQANYDAAFRHFTRSKEIVRRGAGAFDLGRVTDTFRRVRAVFTAELFATAPRGSASEQPVFIVGMPRSGTTLTEQIVASHPRAFGAGELPDLPRIVKGLRPGYPETIASFDAGKLSDLAAEYLAALQKQAPADVLRITDKLPLNFAHLGLVALLFPHARIVHCRRDPLDIGLSCMVELFSMDNDYTTDLDSFGRYYLEYARLMAHWREVLPLPMLELQYEAMVEDPDAQIRRLVEFCRLPWDATCLEFGATDRVVSTPSRWQVRQPIYQGSVGRWRHYAAHIEPLRRMLAAEGLPS
jgi:tetratricopeptide (TPR) repeat protein